MHILDRPVARLTLFLLIAALNLGLLYFGTPGTAIANSDPVVVAFAIYGLCHIEMWMAIWAFRLNAQTARILADLQNSTVSS